MQGKRIVALVVSLLILLSSLQSIGGYDLDNSTPSGGSGPDYPPPASGDWLIFGDTSVWDENLTIDGNLIITDTGKLTLNNVTLNINCTSDGQYKIRVNSTGEFYVYDSNITAYNTAFKYRFEVYGRLWTNHSTIEYPWGDENAAPYTGGIQIYGAGSEVWLNHTKVWRSGANGIHAINAVGVNITGDCNITGNTRNEVWVENSKYFNFSYSNFTDYIDIRIGDGIRFVNASDVMIDHCWVAHHQSDSIRLENVSYSTLTYNDIGLGVNIIDNWCEGISLAYCNSTVRIAWNNITNHSGGINLWKKSSPIIENNNISDNGAGIDNGNIAEAFYSEFYIYNNTIENNQAHGILMYRSNGTIINNTVGNNSAGVDLQDNSNATIINNTFWTDNIDMYNSYAWVEDCYIKSNIAFFLNASSPFVVNTTIEITNSGDTVFYLENNSHPFSLNCTVDYLDRHNIKDTSNLTVQNYLHARVVEPDGFTTVPNAWVNVTDNGQSIYSGQTDINGEIQWIVATNRTYLQDYWNIFHPFTNITYNETIVQIEKDGYIFTDNPRTVGMDVSHWEIFQALDTTLPVISHTPVTSANISETINITANITDDVSVDAVYLNYTDVYGANYNVPMSKWNGNWSYDIPGQGNIGFVDYFIWANDTSNNPNQTLTYPIQIYDMTDPKIYHTAVTSANISETINITANVTDDVGMDAVYLNYTGVNGTNYNVSMIKWNGNWSYDIPGQDTIGFVDYFIWCNDTSGNDNRTIEYSIQINDIVKPEINHVPVVSVDVSETINITVNVTDDVEVDKVYLNYTDVDGISHNVSMVKWNGNYSFEITGQNDIGVVSYFVWANDTSGNDNQTAVNQIQIFDVVKPEIEHMPVTSANISEVMNITATITDDIDVDSVYLNYTDINGINQNVSMTKWDSNWSYEISGQNNIGIVSYFIWANDTSGNYNRTIAYSINIIDNTPPTIISKSPTGDNVSISTTITITFSESMNISSVENAITISPNATISGYSWSNQNQTVSLSLSANLSYNTTYNVTISTGAKDVAGNGLENPYSWEFKTGIETITNGPDDGGIGEYWWIVIIIIIAVILAVFLFGKKRKREEVIEEEKEEIDIQPVL